MCSIICQIVCFNYNLALPICCNVSIEDLICLCFSALGERKIIGQLMKIHTNIHPHWSTNRTEIWVKIWLVTAFFQIPSWKDHLPLNLLSTIFSIRLEVLILCFIEDDYLGLSHLLDLLAKCSLKAELIYNSFFHPCTLLYKVGA